MTGAVERAIRKEATAIPGSALQASDETIGEILVAQGVMNADDVSAVAAYASEKGVRFGDAAVATKVIRQEDLDQALAHQYRFPYVKPGKGMLSKELVVAYKPFSKQADIFRYVRAQLMLGTFQADKKVLAIVSPTKNDGRSYLTANLAVAFAQLGKKTLLIDCHMQKARQHELFRLVEAPGVSAVLSGRSEADTKPTPVSEIANLSVFQAGACPPNPDELIAGEGFARLVLAARRAYDIVLVDTPPGDSSTAVDWIAARCTNVLIVYRQDKTSIAEAKDFTARMRARASVVGSILNTH